MHACVVYMYVCMYVSMLPRQLASLVHEIYACIYACMYIAKSWAACACVVPEETASLSKAAPLTLQHVGCPLLSDPHVKFFSPHLYKRPQHQHHASQTQD